VTNFNGISLSTVEKAAAFYEPLRYSFRAADRWKAEVGYISFVAAPPHREFGMHPKKRVHTKLSLPPPSASWRTVGGSCPVL